MDNVKTILRGLNLCKNGPPPTETRNQSRHSSQHNKAGDADSEVEALLRVLASSLIAYALRKYASSGHNQKRRKAGGVDVDFVMLEKVGQTILDKLIQAGAKASKKHKESKRSAEEAENKRDKRHGDGRRDDRHRSRHDRPERDPSHVETEDHRHAQRRRHRRRDHDEEHPRPHRRQQPDITVTPPTLSSHSQSPDDGRGRSRRRRTSIVRAEERPPEDKTHDRRAELLDMASLRDRLEGLSAAIIELSARSAAGDGVQGHGECEFYDRFVENSGPVQEAIGDVLAQIREAEEAKGEGRRRRRRRRDRTDA